MDVRDLPVPLSRIETLWNCLITGETPDFEPLSRNEKYLMAMLDRYDISNLPTPMSRGEKLLYKIAVGETDLSDVPGYLSRYEELLKYLIENGGISGGDFEYVLYTLNQSLSTLYTTAEKPVKSAILKGQTLVNVNRSNYTVNTNITDDYGQAIEFYDADMLPNTTYTIIMYSDNPYECRFSQMYNDREYALSVVKVGTPFVFTTVENYQGLRSYLKGDELNIPQGTEIKILIIKGDYTNIDIPYFEGMQSVKMPVLTTTGKNILDPSSVELVVKNDDNSARTVTYDSVTDTYEFLCPNSFNQMKITLKNLYKVTNVEQVYVSGTYENEGKVYNMGSRFTLNKDGLSLNIIHNWKPVTKANLKIMITVDNNAITTAYEPYKSNILTVNEEVELRGVGEVKDELNLLTGELTQRIGEIVLNGSEKWGASSVVSKRYSLEAPINSIVSATKILCICDKFPSITTNQSDHEQLLGIAITNGHRIMVNTNYDTIDEFKQYLQQNPITVQYQLATESVKTVDLTVVDQDNQPAKLGTFENVTHVSLEAENLIPEVEMEVATRISTELASASPLMDDISTEQQQLETTVDEQSNNVDATMIATTEIYEETL